MSAVAARIHPTAVIHPDARIASDVEIGPYAVIGEDVSIGAGTSIGPHAVVEFAEIGRNCRLHASCFVGTAPQDLKYKGERTRLVLGDGCIVRECATLNRGTAAAGVTRIGKNCLFMAYSHVAHDCVLGDGVILANCAALAGHVEVADRAVIGGLAAVHQFVRIGRLAMVGGGAKVAQDVPPFLMVQGDRARITGINAVGIRRAGLDGKILDELKWAYRTLFLSGVTLAEALDQTEASGPGPEVLELVRFIRDSRRGICGRRRKTGDEEEDSE